MDLFPYPIYKKVRELTAPIEKLLELIPYNAIILDVGCGRGVITERIIRERAPVKYVGVDIDETRILNLRKRFGDAEFVSMDAIEYLKILRDKKETFNCILFSDILYLFDEKNTEILILEAYELLQDGGIIIIKEVDFSIPVWLQEFLSLKVLRMTKGKNIHLKDIKFYERLFADKQLNFAIIKYMRLWYPHLIITIRK